MTTTLGSLFKGGNVYIAPVPPSVTTAPFNAVQVAGQLWAIIASAGIGASPLGTLAQAVADIHAWANQDDDAHDTCDWDSLVACRNPLHPGPCKGWKGTLHSVAPGTYHQVEAARVAKANERRVKKIADLKAQGKPIPRRLLDEIKPKAAPGHPAHGAQPVSLGQVNQKADLAGGQAHTAGQAVSKAAGVQVNTAPPLPLGPKGKKPSVSGRGPAFVITQPKVTDTYKLDKAQKITPQEWAGLSDADKTTILNELTAIKARGFGPQQSRAAALLAQLPAPGAHRPGSPSANPAATPGKISLAQAHKTLGLPAPAPATATPPKAAEPDITDQVKKSLDPSAKLLPSARLFVHRRMSKAQFDSLDDATQKQVIADLDHQAANGMGPQTQQLARDLKDRFQPGASGKPSPSAPPSGIAPSAPLAPGTAAHLQVAKSMADRTGPKAATSKAQVDAYDKLSKADFDTLPTDTQKTIRDDLANAKAKFLDPKKQKAAADLLDRFGAKHPAAAPAHPSGAPGYSDPQTQAVKAVSGGDATDDVLKAVGRLSPSAVKDLSDADRTKILHRMAFIATHPKATPGQKAKATAYGRIINKGSDDQKTMGKLDHEPSLGELHAHEEKTAAAKGQASAAKIAGALDAAKVPVASRPGAQRADTVQALAGLDKAQFDSLKPDEQRMVVRALQGVHHENSGYGKLHDNVSTMAGEALTKYTGHHPAVQRALQAETDFRAGKIAAADLHTEILHARVQTGTPAIRAVLQEEEQRIAEDNPTLPTWLRAALIENKYSGTRGNPYGVIAQLSMKHQWDPAPRMSLSDFEMAFHSTDADLANIHPIHVAAIKEYREHLISTGLIGSSPWSDATKDQLVNSLLTPGFGSPVVTDARMSVFHDLTPASQMKVRVELADRIASQTHLRAKVESDITLRQLQGHPYQGEQLDAALAARDASMGKANYDIYRKLPPTSFHGLSSYARDAINEQLDHYQRRVEGHGQVVAFDPSLNALKEFPAALKAQLNGTRTQYVGRAERNASDIANYGQGIVEPEGRVDAYRGVSVLQFRQLPQDTRDKIHADLDKIGNDSGNPLGLRYQALRAKDIDLSYPTAGANTPHNADQIVAIASVDPANPTTDGNARAALFALDKADYDKLNKTYREAIDLRVQNLSDPMLQQVLTTKFHPATPGASTPAGMTPTAPASVQPHVQEALDTIYGVHPKSHTMAHQLKTYGALRGHDFTQLNAQEQSHLLSDLSFIETTAKGPSAAKAKLLIDRFTPAGTPPGTIPAQPIIPPANALPGQVRYATPLKGLEKSKNPGVSGDQWITTPNGRRVWGKYGASGMLIKHTDPATGEERYLMVQRGPAISDPGLWTFPGGASESKETPHQGATRETIEELGLKDDQFKDAQVHGDFTYSIPNSTWKYTSVAVSVPQQFQPNLSTAHARAETSDAKWMTIDEIRALDKSGKLHGPIAGGLLEKNVISLYPTAAQQAGTTLGQVVRPGPVSKRLKRLTLPPGGRQAPTQFNAWPHAHKPSTGKDLVGDKAAIDKLRQDVKKTRAAYDGKTGDGRLAAIGAMQGYDATPTVVSRSEIDRLLATGDYIEAWRGVRGSYNSKSAADINEDFRSGTAWYGRGIFGNGYYLATQKSVAQKYADHSKNSVVRMLIPKSAITEHYKKIQTEARANSSRVSKAKGTYEDGTLYDAGRWAAAKGVDGIQINHDTTNDSGGWARHVAAPGKPAFNWLNRAVLIVQEADK